MGKNWCFPLLFSWKLLSQQKITNPLQHNIQWQSPTIGASLLGPILENGYSPQPLSTWAPVAPFTGIIACKMTVGRHLAVLRVSLSWWIPQHQLPLLSEAQNTTSHGFFLEHLSKREESYSHVWGVKSHWQTVLGFPSFDSKLVSLVLLLSNKCF